MGAILKQQSGDLFLAKVVAHDWRGSSCLCIGVEGYDDDSFVCLSCDEETKRLYPVGTRFMLVQVES